MYQMLKISRMALWRYQLPKNHPKYRPMPPDVRKRYEKLKKGPR